MRVCRLVILLLLVSPSTEAHVGSPDVFFEGAAGPYQLLVRVSPPAMVPGVAEVQVRVMSGTVGSISVTPVYVNGKDQGLPPSSDFLEPSAVDPQWLTGRVWMMESGSWEVRLEVRGNQGNGKLAVPVPVFARRTLPMEKPLGSLLFGLLLFLSIGIVSIAGAAAREGGLACGTVPSRRNRRVGQAAMAASAVLVVTLLALGNWWWNLQAADLERRVLYRPPPLRASLLAGDPAKHGADRLTLQIEEDFWHKTRSDEWSMSLITDHGHLMHLFFLRVPGLDRFYHLHPEPTSDGSFTASLPAIPAGRYRIFADIVRGTGFPETLVSDIDLPNVEGPPLSGDDSGATASPFDTSAGPVNVARLSDGSRMVWERETATLKAGQASWFRFRVEGEDDKPVKDMEPYMGMAGHAEFVGSDLSVFAHVHPAGSVPMASLMIVEQDLGIPMDHSKTQAVPAELAFPYGFPKPGEYRLFVQVKRHGQVQTGVFDAHVGS
jgi:hypothetical protein